MRVVEFLIQLLQAHAMTLQRLAALLGEERLIELLERAGDDEGDDEQGATEPGPGRAEVIPIRPEWLTAPTAQREASAYSELESAVGELQLAPMLEFHVWAYPHYRAFIESPLDLNSRIKGEACLALVQEAVLQAEAWMKRLPLPPAVALQSERAAQVPWVRFRTEVLRRAGQRPLGAI
jgi:hypothetical protein